MKLAALAISAALLFSACEGPLEQAQREASSSPPAHIEPPVPLPGAELPVIPPSDPSPIGPAEDLLPGGHGWPTWGDCSDSLAC
jgi:hypothetical protein